MNLKNKYEDYTESEFLELLNRLWAVDEPSEAEHDELIEHFSKITEHPQGNGLIFYPEVGIEDSPQGVMAVVKKWRADNGKPGFKES